MYYQSVQHRCLRFLRKHPEFPKSLRAGLVSLRNAREYRCYSVAFDSVSETLPCNPRCTEPRTHTVARGVNFRWISCVRVLPARVYVHVRIRGGHTGARTPRACVNGQRDIRMISCVTCVGLACLVCVLPPRGRVRCTLAARTHTESESVCTREKGDTRTSRMSPRASRAVSLSYQRRLYTNV